VSGNASEKLVRMANQIGLFFAAMPDREQAINDTAGHLRRSWEPRMRRALFAHIDEHGTEGLSDILIDVVTNKRQELEPPPV
jgi:formate dehydrogenase subunit delta